MAALASAPTVDEDAALARRRFGTDEPVPLPQALSAGPLSLLVDAGRLRRVTYDGVEVIRGIDAPVRNADWGTFAETTLDETVETDGARARYQRRYRVGEAFDGTLTADLSPDGLVAALTLTALADTMVNRAGFTVLHPLAGVVGAPLTVTHADGRRSETAFPRAISPGQPVFDIKALAHEVGDVSVAITFKGDVFEMEDQRNWTDASYKTYCRPLGAPRPFAVAAGEVIRQTITVALSPGAGFATVGEATADAETRVPALDLALEPALFPSGDAALMASIPFRCVALRVSTGNAADALREAARLERPIRLEMVVGDEGDVAGIAAACQAAGVAPVEVMALPAGYLASIQPEGPWPDGLAPEEALAAARSAFPGAAVGAGMLTNFTELNRRRAADGDFLTFGTCAIVHAADDRSVMETLEALPDVYASANAFAEGRPLRLGLTSIGLRSNPYGAAVAANPARVRTPMAMADPRQSGLFAAAFCVGAVAAAARAEVASLCPAFPAGPLGLADGEALFPLFHAVRALAEMSGETARVSGGPGGVVSIMGARGGVVANVSDEESIVDGEAAVLDTATFEAAARDPDFALRRSPGPHRLEPLAVAFPTGAGA